MELRDKLIDRITNKYGSVTRFCRIVDMKDHAFYNQFKGNKSAEQIEEAVRDLNDLVDRTDNTRLDNGSEITEELIHKIKLGIYSKYKNVNDFCKQEGYYNAFMSNLLGGKILRISDKVRAICNKLEIEI